MSEKQLSVSIVSWEGNLYQSEALSVNMSVDNGELGVRPGHAQLLATFQPGPVRIETTNDSTWDSVYVSGGVIEVQPDQVIILADEVERAQNIDEAQAKMAKERAEALLVENDQNSVDLADAQEQLKQADARLQAIAAMRGIHYSAKH